jgi:hypothetical protein
MHASEPHIQIGLEDKKCMQNIGGETYRKDAIRKTGKVMEVLHEDESHGIRL